MGLFNKKKEEDEIVEKTSAKSDVLDIKEADVKSSKKSVKKSVVKDSKVSPSDGQMAYEFIVKPWITEKAQELMGAGKYIFRVKKGTTKREARVAVERLYDVRVADVNIINIPSKKRKFGRFTGKKSAVRKAVVTLKKGDKIEIFE